jgi:predicted TPR repeat methyltransferase
MTQEITADLRTAMLHHQRGDLEFAEGAYRRILATEPTQPDALHYLGMLNFQQKRPAEAIELLKKSLESAPANHHAWSNLGNMLMAIGGRDDARACYERAVELAPELVAAWHNLGILHRRARRMDESIACFQKVVDYQQESDEPGAEYRNALECLVSLLQRTRRLDEMARILALWVSRYPEDPAARHMAAASLGKDIPSRASPEYVRQLYERFADSFDNILAALDYQAPQLLIDQLAAEPEYQTGRARILDAGCGTGLCGPLLRSSAQWLVGVDLSPAMLDKARERELYDDLQESELCQFMAAHAAEFDVVVLADTLEYFGDLVEIFAVACKAMRPGGLLLCSLEAMPADKGGAGFQLQPHGRYCHSAQYVRDTILQAGLAEPSISVATLRKEYGEDVSGLIVSVRRPR